jgi:hypothetical protein
MAHYARHRAQVQDENEEEDKEEEVLQEFAAASVLLKDTTKTSM